MQKSDNLPKSFWLSSPFLVLLLVMAGLAASAGWARRTAVQRSAPARAALARSVRALDTLAELHRASSLEDRGRLADRFAAERGRLLTAAGELERAGLGSLQLLADVSLLWALAGIAGGALAALLVLRYLRRSDARLRGLLERTGELEQFATRVAHDLVSPLGPVTAGIHMLAQRLRGDPRAQGVARVVRESVDRVSATVDELLRFAWSGGRPQPGESADLNAVFGAVRDELMPAAQEQGVSLTFEPAPRVRVACGEAAVAVVLRNLVGNAIRYLGAAPVRLVRTSVSVLAGKVRLTVHDTGPGIPEGMEAAVFEPYVRGDQAAPGLGLGLATVKRIVESRSGRVGVTSVPRKGAAFWVELPLTHALN